MRGNDVEARIRQDRAELRILPGGDGHVPAVEKHVDETVTGVYRARDRAVGDSARRLQRARDGEYGGRRLCQGVVCAGGSAPGTSPSRWSPTSLMVTPAASSAAHRLPDTTWLTSARTSHPWHGVGAAHWPWRTQAMTPLVASSARPCRSAMSMMVLLWDAWLGWLRLLGAGPVAVVADGSRPGDQVPEGIVLAVAAAGLAAAGEGRGQRLAGGRLAGVLDSQPGRP